MKKKARERRLNRILKHRASQQPAWLEGNQARLDGKTLGHNPYAANGRDYGKHHSWRGGFIWGDKITPGF